MSDEMNKTRLELESDINDLRVRVGAFDPGGAEYIFVRDLWEMILRLRMELDGLCQVKAEFDDKWDSHWACGVEVD